MPFRRSLNHVSMTAALARTRTPPAARHGLSESKSGPSHDYDPGPLVRELATVTVT